MIYQTIYQKLYRLIPNLEKIKTHVKLKDEGLMDLRVDVIRREEEKTVIALAHSYIQNNDPVPDPEMVVAIYPDMQMAEALSYQDSYIYQRVFPRPGYVCPKRKKELNHFLNNWLTTLLQQDYKIASTPTSGRHNFFT